MIEMERAPLAFVVAALTLGAVPPAMDVLNSVAIHAYRADVLVPFAHMACGAGHAAVGAAERELRPLVIERLHPPPRGLGMAFVACFAQTSFVRIVCLVTIEAAGGRGAELHRF